MKLFAVIAVLAALLAGCQTTGGGQSYVTCEEAQAYINAVDAAVAALPPGKDADVTRRWYAVARAGAAAYMVGRCPPVVAK